ncbi:hypothetical protein PLANPX_1415 [Lacipirellula parvula]|uniref:Uncharacterized protein n=1 Tax=Lacipirellula parvula TaxID=2650471 RepID=A0A5K7XBY6_9BACT|nr:hypothetical protein PLANPX_1415 [Lacipirellula parvula]
MRPIELDRLYQKEGAIPSVWKPYVDLPRNKGAGTSPPS